MLNTITLKKITSLLVIFTTLLLTACGSAPKREPYSGPDNIGAVDANLIVGQWRMTIVNPVGKENDNNISYNFLADGSFTSEVTFSEEQTEALGPMKFEGKGTWSVQGDKVVAKTNSINETTGSTFGALMKAVVSASAAKSTGEMNPVEMSSDRIVWVHPNGIANMLERL